MDDVTHLPRTSGVCVRCVRSVRQHQVRRLRSGGTQTKIRSVTQER